MEISFRSSPPSLESRVRVFSIRHSAFSLFFFVVLGISAASSSPYAQYCDLVVPEPSPTDASVPISDQFKWLPKLRFDGGGQIFSEAATSGAGGDLHFRPSHLYRTLSNGVYKVKGELTLENRKSFVSTRLIRGRWLLNRPRWSPVLALFSLEGFWSSVSGKLCMVGPGSITLTGGKVRSFRAVLKLNYRNSSSITVGVVDGSLESLDIVGSSVYFDLVSILGVSLTSPAFRLIEKESENGGFNAYDGYENVSLGSNKFSTICSPLFKLSYFSLEYEEDCSTVRCNPLGGSSNNLPSFMSLDKIWCLDNQRVRTLLLFFKHPPYEYDPPLDPNATLVAEGMWDEKKNRLCLIACRLASALHGDCSIKFCIRFPATVSIKNSSTAVGEIWSNKTVDDTNYFGKIRLQGRGWKMMQLRGWKYEYTMIDKARTSCVTKKTGRHKGRKYPNGFSRDMSINLSVRGRKGQRASGRITPLTVGDQFYRRSYIEAAKPVVPKNLSNSSFLNVSYRMRISPSHVFKLGGEIYSEKYVEISAEGTYNTENGVLCLIGCRHLQPYNNRTNDGSMDCEIHVRIQYPPLNAKARTYVTGMIQSTRRNSDPLYFDPLELAFNSIYTKQAADSIRRMDLEIIMVLISNTLACVFVGLQLFYVRRHPDVLPFISIVLLIVLTLAHLIPLVLNFEALFLAGHNHQNVFLGSEGWLEVNEVIVRVVTLIAFLLLFRLLQLTWTSRGVEGSQKGLWVSDKKVLYLSLPFYVGGGMIAWFVQQWKGSHLSPFLRRHTKYKQNYLWGALRSYAGLVLDGFLLPQIIFNLFSDSGNKALVPSFYVGTTIVRLLPHAYDLYRVHSSPWSFGLSFIYANPKMDLYSTAWDIIIPCCGLLFAGLIYLQQRFGGRCILPKRFRERTVYEKVPVGNGE